ncbi:MAG: hypothetical protein M0R74_03105 [Dehalococcoidia bacterium]|nr:hypothetical protein [Dehalococcoidia bacterium]
MEHVRISRVAVAHPRHRISQDDAAGRIAEVLARSRFPMAGRRLARLTGVERRVKALARGSHIACRALVLPPADLERLGSIQERNDIYQQHAVRLASHAATGLEPDPAKLRALVTSSCTGYSVPGWGGSLVEQLGLRCDTMLLPITEAGCAGGLVALARTTDFLRSHPGGALVVACELCSLAFQPDATEGNLTASLIFGDGAGAALLETGTGPALEVIDSASMLIPRSREVLGFALTDTGFYPILDRRLVDLLPAATGHAAAALLARHGLTLEDVGAWLVHPGGARILERLAAHLRLGEGALRWSWDSLREAGNTSSAAIFDVLRRYLAEPRPQEWALVIGFGPGVSVELLLVRRSC